MQDAGPTIYVLCVVAVGLLGIVVRHFIKSNGHMCTVVCLKAGLSGAVTVTGQDK